MSKDLYLGILNNVNKNTFLRKGKEETKEFLKSEFVKAMFENSKSTGDIYFNSSVDRAFTRIYEQYTSPNRKFSLIGLLADKIHFINLLPAAQIDAELSSALKILAFYSDFFCELRDIDLKNWNTPLSALHFMKDSFILDILPISEVSIYTGLLRLWYSSHNPGTIKAVTVYEKLVYDINKLYLVYDYPLFLEAALNLKSELKGLPESLSIFSSYYFDYLDSNNFFKNTQLNDFFSGIAEDNIIRLEIDYISSDPGALNDNNK